MSVPSISTEPDDGASSPAMRPSSVDLPLPDAPTIATNCPFGNGHRQRLEDGERMRAARDGLGDVAELNHSGFTIGRKALQTVSATFSAPAAVG